MFPYIPSTPEDEKSMLEYLGLESIDEIFSEIPDDTRLNKSLDLESPKSELEVSALLQELSEQDLNANNTAYFVGAGVYDHYIPSVVNHLVGRSEFYTAYTPYQPEISQGTLQGIFEYQSMICSITGMDVSNASLYDGASAVAEAALMAVNVMKKRQIIVSQTVNPESRRVLSTYMNSNGIEVITIPMKEGITDSEVLKNSISKDTAAFIIQIPNFLGYLEDIGEIEKVVHDKGALLVLSVNPISLGVLKSPREWGADIAVGEGQSLGNSMSFGGPMLGFMACNKSLMRKMPGRIIGQTHDADGKRGFVSTLQTREQHIRREKATSNICSNQALNALTACIYLAVIGKQGLVEVAKQCYNKAHYAMERITSSGKYKLLYDQPFFNEFPLLSDIAPNKIQEHLLDYNIIGGYALEPHYPELKNVLLYCVTEKRSRQQIDKLQSALEELS